MSFKLRNTVLTGITYQSIESTSRSANGAAMQCENCDDRATTAEIVRSPGRSVIVCPRAKLGSIYERHSADVSPRTKNRASSRATQEKWRPGRTRGRPARPGFPGQGFGAHRRSRGACRHQRHRFHQQDCDYDVSISGCSGSCETRLLHEFTLNCMKWFRMRKRGWHYRDDEDDEEQLIAS